MSLDEIQVYGESNYNYETAMVEVATQESNYADFYSLEILRANRNHPELDSYTFLIALEWGMYNSIGEGLINQWVDDILAEGIFTNVIVAELTYGTPAEYRSYFQSLRNSDGLASVVLVGDHPAAYFEQVVDVNGEPSYDAFPCDFYYMDLTGLWQDGKEWDSSQHSWIQSPDGIPLYDALPGWYTHYLPEISCSRLLPSNLNSQSYRDEVGMIREYLIRNHEWRTGTGDPWSKRACLYVDHDWLDNINDLIQGMSGAYSGCNNVFTSNTNDTNFRNRLGTGYDWFAFWVHSNYTSHTWDYQRLNPSTTPSTILSEEIVDAYSRFYTVNGCKCGRFTVPHFYGYFAGYYLFATDALGVISCTTTAGMLHNTSAFFDNIGEGKTVGYSFMIWFCGLAQSGVNAEAREWYLGEVLFGDPTLVPQMHRVADFGSHSDINVGIGSREVSE